MATEHDIKALIKAGKPRDAVQVALEAAAAGGVADRVLALGGQAAYVIGANSEALELFAQLDVRTQLDGTQLAMMGHAADLLGVHAAALSAYRRALGLNDRDLAVHFNLGSLHLRRHEWSDAIRHLECATDLKPDWAAAWGNLGCALLGTERYGRCLEFFRACMVRFPAERAFHAGLAETLMKMGEHGAAESEFRQMLKHRASDPEAWAGLIAAVVQDNRFEEARIMIAEAQGKSTGSPELDEIKASLALEAGDAPAAIRQYEEVLNASPRHRRARLNLIEAYLAAGQAEKALKFCDDILAAAPGDADMLAYKALVLIDLGRVEESARFLPPDLVMGYRPVCPDGFASMADFNKAMVDHILGHPSLTPSPFGHATVKGLHTGSLVCEPWGPMKHFTGMIAEGAKAYKKRNGPSGHPFFHRWNDDYSLTVWAVVMEEGSHQMPHIHPSGYLSGVYYPLLPDQVRDPGSTDGMIEFFDAPEQFNLRHPAPAQIFPPQEGVMFLFPSAYFHRTIPYTGGGTRISVAFDLVPR
ncbi:MAG: tetratricopeptide repeat protein [Rhodospirillaceae bacterium]